MKAAHVTIALALLGTLVVWFAATRSSDEIATIGPAPKPRNDGAMRDRAVLETVDAAAIATDPSGDELARIAVESDSQSIPEAGVGRLIVRAVDAATDEPLRLFAVRLASETRFADERSRNASGELVLPLTSDTYSIVVSAPGYESRELEPTRVRVGETDRLEPVKLRRGAGRLVVEVRDALPEKRQLQVELIGAGRHPCERCGDSDGSQPAVAGSSSSAVAWDRTTPCPTCGFARERSLVQLVKSARCEFSSLASGNFALRVIDGREFTVCAARELALDDSESALVELDLSGQRYVQLEFFDVDGQSLSETWRTRFTETLEETDIVSFENYVRQSPISLSVFDDARNQIACASLIPPMPNGVWISVAAGRGAFHRKDERAMFDRARRPDDKLWPESAPARFADTKVACDVEDNGFARIGPLPSSRLELQASVEHFEAAAVVPASRATTRIALTFQAKRGDPNATLEFATYSAYELAGMK